MNDSLRLNITKATTAADIQGLMAQADPSKKTYLRAETKNGVVSLYLSERKPSLKDKITHKAAERSQAAREVVKQVIKSQEQAIIKLGLLPEDQEKAIKALRVLSNDVAAKSGRSMRPAEVTLMMKIAQKTQVVYGQTPAPLRSPSVQAHDLPRPAKLLDSAVVCASVGLTNPVLRDDAASSLKDAIVAQFKDPSGAPKSVAAQTLLIRFVLADNAPLIKDMAAAIGEKLPSPVDAKIVEDFVKVAVGAAVAELGAPNQVVENQNVTIPDTTSIGGPTRSLPTMKFDGVDYKPVRYLGHGGGGRVYAYHKVGDPTHLIAVKFASAFGDDGRRNLINEIAMQANLSNTIGGRIVGLIGATLVETADDYKYAIAMPLAPNGDVTKLVAEASARAAKHSSSPGSISPAQQRAINLTLAKDMMNSLAWMHHLRAVHYDVKPGNSVIDADGVAKIIDFGQSYIGTSPNYDARLEKVATLVYGSPEAQRYMGTWKTDAQTRADAAAQVLLGEFAQAFPKADPAKTGTLVDSLTALLLKPEAEHAVGQRISGRREDVWAMGASFYEMMTGRIWLEGANSSSEVASHLATFAASGAPAIGPNVPPSLAPSTGDAALDALLNQMLDPDPARRIDLNQALRSPLFQETGVGAPETRALIKAIASKDETAIDWLAT
jgi:serine/threonine protein kinase